MGRFVPSQALTDLVVSSLDSQRLALGESLVPRARTGRGTPEAFLQRGEDGEEARNQIAHRMALFLAALASRAAGRHQTKVQVASAGHFVPEIVQELLTRFPVEESQAGRVFDGLCREFFDYVRTTPMRGNWGRLVIEPNDSLVMEVSPIEVRPAEGQRAEVVVGRRP